jgi:ParB family chromosome partitioning protein
VSGPVYLEVPLALINEPPAPIRQGIKSEGIEDLARSIADHGQLQPIGLVPDGDRYNVVYGHRRYLALAVLNDRPARALVFESTSEAMLGAQLAENVDREDMGPVDEAYWFAQLLEGLHTDTTHLAERLKMNRDYIEGRLALLHGDADVLSRLRLGDIKLGIAKMLNTVGDTKMRRLLLDMCVHREAKAHTLTQWIAELKATGRLVNDDPDAPPPSIGDAADIEAPPPIQCCFCDDSDEPWTMEPYWIHKHCKKALGNIIRHAADASPVRNVEV